MQALAFACSVHFAKSGPPRESIAMLDHGPGSPTRARAQQVEWCRCTVHVLIDTSRSDRLLFRLAALRPSEGPQRSALVDARSRAKLRRVRIHAMITLKGVLRRSPKALGAFTPAVNASLA